MICFDIGSQIDVLFDLNQKHKDTLIRLFIFICVFQIIDY